MNKYERETGEEGNYYVLKWKLIRIASTTLQYSTMGIFLNKSAYII